MRVGAQQPKCISCQQTYVHSIKFVILNFMLHIYCNIEMVWFAETFQKCLKLGNSWGKRGTVGVTRENSAVCNLVT